MWNKAIWVIQVGGYVCFSLCISEKVFVGGQNGGDYFSILVTVLGFDGELVPMNLSAIPSCGLGRPHVPTTSPSSALPIPSQSITCWYFLFHVLNLKQLFCTELLLRSLYPRSHSSLWRHQSLCFIWIGYYCSLTLFSGSLQCFRWKLWSWESSESMVGPSLYYCLFFVTS